MTDFDDKDYTLIEFNESQEFETEQMKKIKQMREAFNAGSDSFISVNRQQGNGQQKMQFVCRYETDDLDIAAILQDLQMKYGGGKYRLIMYVGGKIIGNMLHDVANPVVSPAATGDSTVNTILAQMQEMQRQLIESMKNNQPEQSTRRELMQDMLLMKQLFDGGNSGGIGEVLKVVSGLKDLGINIGGESQKEEGFSDLAEKLLPLASAFLTPQVQSPVVPVYKQNPIDEEEKRQRQKAQKMNIMLRAGLNQLLNAARKGSDAGTYASLVIDNVPIEALNNFFLNASLDDLAKLNPEVNNFKPWFFELAEHIKANLGLDSTVSHLYESDDSDNVENNEEKPIDK